MGPTWTQAPDKTLVLPFCFNAVMIISRIASGLVLTSFDVQRSSNDITLISGPIAERQGMEVEANLPICRVLFTLKL
jgi:hypothetical protein